MVDIVLADADDWQGLYVDGAIEVQDHSVSLDAAFSVLEGETVDSFERKEVSLDWLEAESHFPATLSDVEFI